MRPSILSLPAVGAALAGVLLSAGCASAPAPEPAPIVTEAPTTPGAVFAECSGCPEMVVIPAGSFVMGSPADEKYRGAEEQHPVTIARPFAVGKYEVTFAQFEMCVREKGCEETPIDEGWGKGRRPVINVDFADTKAYVAWLAKKTGKPYRLLSEAEWEYAARAGTTTPFHTGATLTSEQANFDASTATDFNPKGRNRKRTTPVGSFPPNAFGLHDMHGNAWEWVEDCFNDEYVNAPADGSAWLTGECMGRMLRGGSWYDSVTDLRVAARVSSFVEELGNVDTIRVARDLP